jgi:hypothetical protein
MVENIALALASAAIDGDDADETLNELESGDGLRIHLELSSLVEPVMMEHLKNFPVTYLQPNSLSFLLYYIFWLNESRALVE